VVAAVAGAACCVPAEAAPEARRIDGFQDAFRAPRTGAPSRAAIGIVTMPGRPDSEDARRGAALAVAIANDARLPGEEPFTLEIAEADGRWGTAAEAGRDLRYDRDCLGLITPADRNVAHLLAQVAIRGRVPVMTLAAEASLTRIPDPWIFRVVPDAGTETGVAPDLAPLGDGRNTSRRFREEYRLLHGTDPTAMAACAYDAASAIIAAARHAGLDRAAVRDWLAAADDLDTVTGFARFDGAGNRIERALARSTPRADGSAVRSIDETGTEPREHLE
jgi:ABC-type branched-subunit amino acid transport system substrate-binding protein